MYPVYSPRFEVPSRLSLARAEMNKKTSRKEPQAAVRKPTPVAPTPRPVPAQTRTVVQTKAPTRTIVVNEEWAGEEHRRFPRAKLTVPFELSIGEDDDLRFSAKLASHNISVSGAFLDSSYFLPNGTQLKVSFSPAEGAPPVLARAEIVRQERVADKPGYGHDGFAIRFTEFFNQSEGTLAHLILGLKLRAFAGDYLQSKRARSLTSEFERVVDALAAWELRKVVSSEDIWRTP